MADTLEAAQKRLRKAYKKSKKTETTKTKPLSRDKLLHMLEQLERIGWRAVGWAEGQSHSAGYDNAIIPLEKALLELDKLRINKLLRE